MFHIQDIFCRIYYKYRYFPLYYAYNEGIGISRNNLIIKIIYIKNSQVMKKEEYEKPTMNIVEMQSETAILTSSVTTTRGDGYGEANEEDWD